MEKTTERRGSFILITIVILFTLTVVLTSICVLFLVEEGTNKIIILILLGLLVLVGILACVFLEWQRRRALRKRDRNAELWIRRTLAQQRQQFEPSAPPMSARTSWALSSAWRSNRETMLPPYSPPHSPRNNRTH